MEEGGGEVPVISWPSRPLTRFVCTRYPPVIDSHVRATRPLLMRPNDIYKFKALLPEDYCLIPGNGAIKLVDLD